MWFSPAVFTQKPETRIKRLQNKDIEVVRIAEPVVHHHRNVVDVNYQLYIKNLDTNQIEEFQETHPMRHFSIPEIKHFAEINNFQMLKTEEFLTGNTPSEDTWGVCFVLKKWKIEDKNI